MLFCQGKVGRSSRPSGEKVAYTSGTLGLVHATRLVAGTCSGQAYSVATMKLGALTHTGWLNNISYKERRKRACRRLGAIWGIGEPMLGSDG